MAHHSCCVPPGNDWRMLENQAISHRANRSPTSPFNSYEEPGDRNERECARRFTYVNKEPDDGNERECPKEYINVGVVGF